MNAKPSDSVAQASLPAGYGSVPAPGLGMRGNLGRDAQGTRTLGSARYNRAGILRRWMLDVGCWMFSVCLLSSASAIASVNPYVSTITNRNLFSLKAPVDPMSLVPQAPPPALPGVKLAGITTLLGGKRAILRVARPARPQLPAGEDSLMLAEGAPEESGIKVLEIDIAAATVRISNNGSQQTLDLEKDAPKSAPAPAPPAIPALGQPGSAIPVPQPAPAPGGGVPSVARPIRGAGPSAAGGNAMGIPGAGPAGIAAPQPEQPLFQTADEQEVLIELERDRTRDAVAAGEMPPLPPTGLLQELQQDQQAQQNGAPGSPF